MNRLEQDAADTMAGHEERRRVWGEAAKARWQKVLADRVVTEAVCYERDPEDARQLAQEIEAGLLPF